ncbi:MAG: snoRNA-binding rRNA-processing protein [Cirrosporium novae-zelandiae]|nr:MAG: snoRNA-binding rRNA-processing protein [Cirrosporium novae-zelandiae]
MPKAVSPTTSTVRQMRRHNPLGEDILNNGHLRTKSGKRRARTEDGEEERFVDSKASRKILKIGQDLVEEELQEQRSNAPNIAFNFESRFGEDDESEEEDLALNEDEAWGDEEEIVEEVEVDPSDLALFNKFIPAGVEPTFDTAPNNEATGEGQGTNLADLILEKIAEHEANQGGQPKVLGGGAPEDAIELPAKVVEVYSQIGIFLSRYKSGKLPKPFKIIPSLPHWEDILSITRPEDWTPNACYEATRIFVSSKPHIVQRFLEWVILDHVRDDIRETRKLNVHLYKALKKALYKPAAFFKGFLFPLVSGGTCSVREAHIIQSVLARVSIPVLHSAAALLRLCDIAAEQMSSNAEKSSAANVFIKTLLDKKYALPYKVIDALVFHFLRFRAVDTATTGGDQAMSGVNPGVVAGGDNKLPVMWHQSLKVFAERYHNDITEDQREALLDLLLVRGHASIAPDIRRELLAGRGRGVVLQEGMGDGGDDTMLIDA